MVSGSRRAGTPESRRSHALWTCRRRTACNRVVSAGEKLEQPFRASKFSAVHYTCWPRPPHRFYHAPHCHHYLTTFTLQVYRAPPLMSAPTQCHVKTAWIRQREGRARLGVTSWRRAPCPKRPPRDRKHARPVGGEAQVVRRRALLDETVAKSHASPRRSRVLCSSAPLRRHAPRRHTSATPSRPPALPPSRPTRRAHLAVAKPIRALP